MKLLSPIFLFLAIITPYVIQASPGQKIKIYTHSSTYYQGVKEAFEKFGVPFEEVDTIDTQDKKSLFLIFDLFTLQQQDLPHYYICYQSLDLKENSLTNDYLKKLSDAIAIWDYSNENISHYSSKIYNYFYFPKNYEFAGTVILPCLLPLSTLAEYKNLLAYSNSNNTDISSHLPTLFFYTITQKPKLIIEAGVRGGESTIVFRKALEFIDSKLVGIDIEPSCASVYPQTNKTLFICMNDLDFLNYYYNSFMKNLKIDMVFLDTSHLYQHTLQEITMFEPLLNENGIMIFHDSNVTPINNTGYIRINGTYGSAGGNTRGVTQALKEFFSISFDESKYCDFVLEKNGNLWKLIHYPYCNGLTVVSKL